MRSKYLSYIATIFIITILSSLKCKHAVENKNGQVYLYSFEKIAPLTTDNSKKMITDYLGIKDVHDLTINQDENVAYFVSDEDVNTTFEQNLGNGNFEFSKLTRAYENSVPRLPSNNEAVKIAEDFMKSRNLYPKNGAELKLVHTGGVRAQSVLDGQRAGPVVDKLITLTYGRVLDSLPVIGAGSKIIVNVGDKGEIVGMTRRWRELNTGERKELKTEELFTKSEAEEQARKQIQTEFGQAPYEIKSSAKSYYDGNGNYLQPVWAFDVLVRLDQQEKNVQPVRYLCIIPILKNTPEPLRLNAIDPRARAIRQATDSTKNNTKEKDQD